MKDAQIKILDCTIRDGGYINNWEFPIELVREVYRALSRSGVDYVELGYINNASSSKNPFGPWHNINEEMLTSCIKGIQGAKIAVMADFGKVDYQQLPDKQGSVIDLIRVAVHKNNVLKAKELAEEIKKKGYEVSLNLMGFSGYSIEEKEDLVKNLRTSSIDYIYVADSYGSLVPSQVKEIISQLSGLGAKSIGFHPHNNLQMAFANTLEGIESGVTMVDGTIYGMGRGAGNLPIETLLAYLEFMYPDKYNVLPVLNIIDRFFSDLRQKYGWGYTLPNMLSGIARCHPDYAKNLARMHEFTTEDIWQILNIIRELNPVGYSEEVLEKVVRDGMLHSKNIQFKVPPSREAVQAGTGEDQADLKPAYIDRHKGKDFLILANGPTLSVYRDQIKEFSAKYNPVVMGANFLNGLFIPEYHAFNNKRRFMSYIKSVDNKSKLLISRYIGEEMIRDHLGPQRAYERLIYLDRLDAKFDIRDGIIQTNCRTVSVFLIAVAMVMGAKRIYVAGMDGYQGKSQKNKSHFYKEDDETSEIEAIRQKNSWNLHYLEQIEDYLVNQGKAGINILTPTVYKRFYKGISNYI